MKQETHIMKKFVIGTSLALATLAATPAFAATHHARVPAAPAYPEAYDTNAASQSGLTVNGPGVFSNGQYAGWDPDPNIRFQLMRDPGDLID
jgi:hypothetical protein